MFSKITQQTLKTLSAQVRNNLTLLMLAFRRILGFVVVVAK